VWTSFDSTDGREGSENGTIIRDDEHAMGARITLERDTPTAPFAITCGVYGWMVHTRFFATEAEALAQFKEMKNALESILMMPRDSVSEGLTQFIQKYP